MRSVITAALLMLCVIFGGMKYTSTLSDVSAQLSELNDTVQENLKNGSIDGAAFKIQEMMDIIDEKEEVLDVLGNHEEIDNIRMNMAELKRYTEGGQRIDALSKSEVLGFLFEHLPENYRLCWKNIM